MSLLSRATEEQGHLSQSSLVGSILAIQITLMALGTIAVALRISTRLFILKRRLDGGDWLILGSLLGSYAEGVNICTREYFRTI